MGPRHHKREECLVKRIQLTQGYEALVDDEDFAHLNQFKWCCSREGAAKNKLYAIRWVRVNGKKVKLRMHRVVLGLPPWKDDPTKTIVEHDDFNGLNNQRYNLKRLESQRKNMLKSPGWNRSLKFPTPLALKGNYCEDCHQDTGHPQLEICDACATVEWG